MSLLLDLDLPVDIINVEEHTSLYNTVILSKVRDLIMSLITYIYVLLSP